MKIYVASSWRNERQPDVVEELRRNGYEVYNFRNPKPGDTGFDWSQIDPNWKNWTPAEFRNSLDHDHELVNKGFDSDMAALEWCDICLLVSPCGRSAHLELGWAAGAGKKTVVLLADGEPELMYLMCHHICVSMEEVLSVLRIHQLVRKMNHEDSLIDREQNPK